MTRPSFAALGALVILAGNLYADKPNTKPLHNEITALRKQEKATIAAIKAQYHNVIHRDRVEESVLIKEREALLIQEKEVLAITPTEQHAAIRERYDALRGLLRRDIKIDNAIIDRLHQMEHAQIKHVEAMYNAKVKQIEAEIHAMEHSGTKPKK